MSPTCPALYRYISGFQLCSGIMKQGIGTSSQQWRFSAVKGVTKENQLGIWTDDVLMVLTLRKNWIVNGGWKFQLLNLKHIWNQQSDHVECECSMGHGWVADFSGSMGAMIRHMHCQMGGAINWWLNYPSWPMPGRHGYNKPLNHRNRNPKSNFPFCQNPVSMVPNMCKCHPPWFLMGAPLQLVLYRQGHSSFDGKWCAWTRQMSTELIERSKTCFDTSKTHKIHWHLTFP